MGKPSEPVAKIGTSHSSKEKRGALLSLNLLLHGSLFAYWVFAHVHESSLIVLAESIGHEFRFPRALEFPGRWRFLTLVNMVSAFL